MLHINLLHNFTYFFIEVVAQTYDTDVNKEYVILGNSILLKCQVPSFVADFVQVVSWHTDDEDFLPGENYGYFKSTSESPDPSNPFKQLYIHSGTTKVRIGSKQRVRNSR